MLIHFLYTPVLHHSAINLVNFSYRADELKSAREERRRKVDIIIILASLHYILYSNTVYNLRFF